jgi:hypothetical protein
MSIKLPVANAAYRQVLAIPTHPGLVETLGALAIAHTHLELTMRYIVKTISGLSISDALDATRQDRIVDLRERLKALFKEQKPTAQEKCRLDALLGRAKRLTESRNAYLHAAWSETPAGQAIIKGDNHSWEPAPTKDKVERVTKDILALAVELNESRLPNGFISQVLRRNSHPAETVKRGHSELSPIP